MVQGIWVCTLIEQAQDQLDILTGDGRVKQSPVPGNFAVHFGCIEISHYIQNINGLSNSSDRNNGLETYVDSAGPDHLLLLPMSLRLGARGSYLELVTPLCPKSNP